MNKKLRDKIISALCNYYYCSDASDKQYPDCNIIDSTTCDAKVFWETIEPLLESKEENQNSAAAKRLVQIQSYLEITHAKDEAQIVREVIAALSFGENNKPSAKCYSVDCPAIWNDKCTSTKYSECSILDAE